MTFLYPTMLWALALPLLLALLALARRQREGRSWHKLVSPAHEAELVARTPSWRRGLPFVLMLAALSSGILAAARPINGYTNTEAVASGRNLLIALDISRSMETQDVKPSRLEEARAAAFELVDALPGDKIGLIVFSGEADLVVPLTYDHTALRDALEQVNRSWAGYGGTNFGLVLKRAMQDFTRSAPTGTNALVIFSDGEDTVGTSLELAREAKEKNLLVITVGVGTSIGDSIPDPRGENGLYQDTEGKHVISKLDTTALQRFAEATGGSYFTMGSGADLASFARQAVEKLDRHEEAFSGHKVPRDLFAPFAMAALLLLLAAILLATEWKAARPGAALLLTLLALAASPAEAAPEADSLRAYEEALSKMEEDASAARELFSRALLDEDAALQAACLYELGNLNARGSFTKLRSLYGQGQTAGGEDEEAPSSPTPEQLQALVEELEQGLQPYRDALSIRPGMEAARTNIQRLEEFIRKLREEIERLKQQQQQQQQQNNEGGQDEQQQNEQQNPQGDEQPEGQNPPQDNGQQEPPAPENQQPQGEQPQQPQEQPTPQPRQPEQPQQDEPSAADDKEKTAHRAAGILRMHVDEEEGSPIPRSDATVRPPEKDY